MNVSFFIVFSLIKLLFVFSAIRMSKVIREMFQNVLYIKL